MVNSSLHTFHIPVLGLSYSIDTPLKVAHYGISSVVSIIEDGLIEKMREYHCAQSGEEFVPITVKDEDYRARRVTAYLNLLGRLVKRQTEQLKNEAFEPGADIVKYFELLPDSPGVKELYHEMTDMQDGAQKTELQDVLRTYIKPGSIDVNIMAKVDNLNYAGDGTPLAPEYSDALSAFRGFARSSINSSVVFSAGYNPRLYNYVETFSDFFPDQNGNLNKKIILKVSDFRSALIQGKMLAKKGLWTSEFRIESGLNCGGHAFATEGMLLGPILEEFKNKRHELARELYEMCNTANAAKGNNIFPVQPYLRVTVQGGIGTYNEDNFLREYYRVDGTGWGSPFLLVPEATTVEPATLRQLATAQKSDYFLSDASPLGVPFNNFRSSSAEQQRKNRMAKGRPGSPCYKKFLATDTEFTSTPICTASRQYQDLKIKQLMDTNLPLAEQQEKLQAITAKDCLCEGLTASAYLANGMPPEHNLMAVTICPGPNLAYFSGVFSLCQMAGHIYGRINILNALPRPNMFVNEAQLYIDYLKKQVEKNVHSMNLKQNKYLNSFKDNLLKGIDYYKALLPHLKKETGAHISAMLYQLEGQKMILAKVSI
ncbi:MAG: hypothetical protein K0Q79_578 [Flavipsychrobacter sp.]|jgi:hypothetical protein|nr:hypothetical protein [Flavipsychrobacter sp.]